MPCYSPLRAWRTASGSIVFVERGDIVQTLDLPCGQCIGCRLERSRRWAMRCMHEAQLHEENSFVTLTYDDVHLPVDGSLNYRHFQLFMKSLRRTVGKVRFFMCGEYGELNRRPHYHAILFGYNFPDREVWKQTGSGSVIYRSKILESLWTRGHSSVGDVTFQSAAYVARYVVKKRTGHRADEHYRVVDEYGEVHDIEPEFCHMSLKPGIGYEWLQKFKSDVYPHDYVVVNGQKCSVPRYYDDKYAKEEPFVHEDIKYRRVQRGRSKFLDNTDERLAVKRRVAEARLSQLKRSLE